MRIQRCAVSPWTFLVCRRLQLFFPFSVVQAASLILLYQLQRQVRGNKLLFCVSLWAFTSRLWLSPHQPFPLHTHISYCVWESWSAFIESLTFSSWFCSPPKIICLPPWVTVCYQNVPVNTRCESCVVFFFLPLPLSGKDLSSRSEDDLSCIFGKRQKSVKTQVNKRLHLFLVSLHVFPYNKNILKCLSANEITMCPSKARGLLPVKLLLFLGKGCRGMAVLWTVRK